jgi:hypothetical protein
VTISREAQSIIDYVESTGLAYRVTSVHRPKSTGSYHAARGTDGDSLAVDLAAAMPGVTPVTVVQMAAIYRALLDVSAQLAELIFNGPGITVAVKNGRRVDGPTVYAAVWADHRNHVHAALPQGVFLTPLSHPLRTMEVVMADDPNLPNINGPATFHPVINTTTGECTGYYIFSPETVELHSFGPGAKWYGRSEDLTPG